MPGPVGGQTHHLARPAKPCGTGVLVLSGSSGALETGRADLLARHGATALALRWFGGPGQQPGPWEVPLETFSDALDRLAPDVDRLTVLGSSFGAEAALLTAVHDVRVEAVVAFAPSAVVWAGVTDSGRTTSHWTRSGRVLPFLPFDLTWTPDTDPPAYIDLYRRSMDVGLGHLSAASIRVEETDAALLLVAGGDDQVWPASTFARTLAARRASDQHTVVVTHPGAGHRVVLPGERHADRGARMRRGGSPELDAELGEMAWPYLVDVLRLDDAPPA